MRSRALCVTVSVAAAAAWWALQCGAAAALTLSAPSAALDTVDVTVTVDASEPTGTVWVLADGAVVASRLATPGSEVVFTGVAAGTGARSLTAAIRHRAGVIYSEPSTLTIWLAPARPALTTPSNGYGSAKQMIAARAGAWTTQVSLYLNGRFVRTLNMVPGQTGWFGTQSLPTGVSTVVLVAANPLTTRSYTYRIRRLDFPWPTCIVVDQSEFRLYWVRNGQLVKVYPIAHGKPSTPTPNRVWKILAKYHTSPTSVYGPRKMRLFKQSGSGYVYTAYGIHGTNQPWVIGTRASHGCIRMYNRDVLELFPQVPLGTMVQTRP